MQKLFQVTGLIKKMKEINIILFQLPLEKWPSKVNLVQNNKEEKLAVILKHYQF